MVPRIYLTMLVSRIRSPALSGAKSLQSALWAAYEYPNSKSRMSSACASTLASLLQPHIPHRSDLLVPHSNVRVAVANPWRVQKRFMGGAKKSMAKARKMAGKKHKKQEKLMRIKKREKVIALDSSLKRFGKMRMLWNIKRVLATREGRVMPSNEVTKLQRALGFPKTMPFTKYIRRYPAIFRYTRDTTDRMTSWLEFTDEADELCEEEDRIMKEYHEPIIVETLRKLLMMAPEQKLPLEKLTHVKSSFFFPDDFKRSIIPKYPQYFVVVGCNLELRNYDRALAITAREKSRQNMVNLFSARQKNGRNMPNLGSFGELGSYAFKISLNKGNVLDRKVAARLLGFQNLPFPSPYEGIVGLDPRSMEVQKRVVAVCHEFLSLTVEKKCYVDHISYFRREFRLPEKIEELLERYPHIFYVSHKGERHSVFLKEAYRGEDLLHRHPLLAIKCKFERLMDFKPKRTTSQLVERLPGGSICAESFISSSGSPERKKQVPQTRRWNFPYNPEASAESSQDAIAESSLASNPETEQAEGQEVSEEDENTWSETEEEEEDRTYPSHMNYSDESSESEKVSLAKKLGIPSEEDVDSEEEEKEELHDFTESESESESEEEEWQPRRGKRFKNSWKNKSLGNDNWKSQF